MNLTFVLVLAGTVLFAFPAAAQPAAGAPTEPNPDIFVTLRATEEQVRGSLLALSEESVTLLTTYGTWTYPLTEVSTIQKRGDGSADGALRGAAVLGGICIVTCGQGVNNSGEHVRTVLGNAAFGALFGWWFDREHVGRTTIYRTESRKKPARTR